MMIVLQQKGGQRLMSIYRVHALQWWSILSKRGVAKNVSLCFSKLEEKVFPDPAAMKGLLVDPFVGWLYWLKFDQWRALEWFVNDSCWETVNCPVHILKMLSRWEEEQLLERVDLRVKSGSEPKIPFSLPPHFFSLLLSGRYIFMSFGEKLSSLSLFSLPETNWGKGNFIKPIGLLGLRIGSDFDPQSPNKEMQP